MNLIAVGINHHTAPIELRERLAFTDDETRKFLRTVCDGKVLAEALLLSTCNRTELYAVPASDEVSADYLKDFLVEYKGARKFVERKHFFSLWACGAVKHFFEVASGADSMILGEGQILGQVKEAYKLAAEEKATGAVLNRLCHAAFSVAKRVRNETKLTDGAISVSYAAVELARKVFSDLSAKRVLLIGAGETAELAAMHLREKKATHITITNRTQEKAEALAREIGTSNVITFDYFKERLAEFDIVIAAVANVGEVVSAKELQAAMQKRRSEPMLVLDLGVPRNIDPKASSIYNLFLKDIDDLKLIVEKNLQARREELPKVARIVQEELIAFEQWHNALQVAPTIRELQMKFEAVKQAELERLRHKVSPEEFARMEQLADRIIRKILHYPISTLKSPVDTSQTLLSKLNLIRSIFELESPASN
ncbi:MAG: glutamyl-tRNA reductase [Chloroherpetonaceae bacterium]|nr:glutamyl-tRNA reductase [Chloroherpetonaceae bacterium]